MEKILPERQLMPEGQCLPIHSYASKDDVAKVSAMASCAKEVADTANERIDNLQTDLATCIDTGNIEANNIESDTATIQTGNIGSLTSNTIDVNTITANEVCADILGGQCGSIDNLNTNTITANCIEVQDICINNDICVNNICGTLCGNVCGTDACFSNNINVCECVNAKNINSTRVNSDCICANKCVHSCNIQATCFLCGKEALISCKLCAPKIESVNLISHNNNNTVSNGKYIFVTLCQGHAYFGDETSNWAVSINAANEAAEIITDNSNCISAVYSNDRGCFYIEMKCPYSGGFQYEVSDTNATAPVWKESSFVIPEEYTKRDIIEDKQFTFTGSLYFDKAAYDDMSIEKLEVNEITAKDSNEIIFTSPINACCGICGSIEDAQCLCGCTLNEVLYDAREPICELIPAQASCDNQLADKDFVNSSISTNTAYFMGTYESVACLPTVGVTNNDYAFVTTCHPETGAITYSRYKYSTNDNCWHFEYDLNTTGFTAEQLAALNSGVTCGFVNSFDDITICDRCISNLCELSATTICGTLCGTLCGKAKCAECVGHASTNCNCDYNINFNASTGYAAQLISGGCPLTFNPSTGVLSTNVICANEICGAAASACKVNVLGDDTNSYKPVTFTDGICTDGEICIQCSCCFSFNPNTGMLKANGFTSDGTAYISAECNNEFNTHSSGTPYIWFNYRGGINQIKVGNGNGAGGVGDLCSGTITVCGGIKSGCYIACTSSVTGKPGTCIACDGHIELLGSTPYIDFRVNNACADYSSRLMARCGRVEIFVSNATGCTAATCNNTFCFCQDGIIYGAKAECEVHNAATCSSEYNNCYKLLFTNQDCKAYYSLCCPLWYNPVTGVLCAKTFCGSVVCATNAEKATCAGKAMINGETANGYCDVILKCCDIDANNYTQLLYGNCCTLKFNPRTGVLCTPYFCGNLCGTASCAENATCAGNATCATTATCACCVVLSKTCVDCSMCLLLKLPGEATNRIYVDGCSNLSYNPSTGVLRATTFCGAFCGEMTNAICAKCVCVCETSPGYSYPIALIANQTTGNKPLYTGEVCVCYDRANCQLCASYLTVSSVLCANHIRSGLACITKENTIACEIPRACITLTKVAGSSSVTKSVCSACYYPYKRRLVIYVDNVGQGNSTSYWYKLDWTAACGCICAFSNCGTCGVVDGSTTVVSNFICNSGTNNYDYTHNVALLPNGCFGLTDFIYSRAGSNNILCGCTKHVIQF